MSVPIEGNMHSSFLCFYKSSLKNSFKIPLSSREENSSPMSLRKELRILQATSFVPGDIVV